MQETRGLPWCSHGNKKITKEIMQIGWIKSFTKEVKIDRREWDVCRISWLMSSWIGPTITFSAHLHIFWVHYWIYLFAQQSSHFLFTAQKKTTILLGWILQAPRCSSLCNSMALKGFGGNRLYHFCCSLTPRCTWLINPTATTHL